jgi:DNA-binding NarL/FixJ family response regulator
MNAQYEEKVAEAEAETGAGRHPRPIRVLIADDHGVMRAGLKALLSSACDIEVVADVGDGRDAIRCALELKPDVIVMDISMPGLNGIDAVAALRERHVAARVLMLSMHATTEYVHRAFQAGADGYLHKADAGIEVFAALRTVHAGRPYVSRTLGARPMDMQRSSASVSPLARLSGREREVLQLVVEGNSSASIAALLHLSPKTVDTYRSRLMSKLAVPDLPALVKFAVLHGLTPLD